MTETAYPELDRVQEIFHVLIWNNIVEATLTVFFIKYPFLKVWPVESIIRYLVRRWSNELYGVAKLTMDVTSIRLVNAIHLAEYEKASIRLKIIAIDRGIDSDEFKKAREAYRISLSKFTRFGAVGMR